LLSDRPLRLPVVWDHPLGFALEKPADVGILADNWFPRNPVLAEAINYQVAQGKGEMERLGLGPDGARAIFQTEPGMAGLALFAKDHETAVELGNAYGSEQFRLTVRFLSARSPQGADALDCDLPIARHGGRQNRMVVSHRTGKKTQTAFRLLTRHGHYSYWEATTAFLRVHQIQLHAFEVGLAVVGDELYAGEGPLYLSRLKRDYRIGKHSDEETPLYDGPAMFLAKVEFALPDGTPTTIEIDPPKRFNGALRNLVRYG